MSNQKEKPDHRTTGFQSEISQHTNDHSCLSKDSDRGSSIIKVDATGQSVQENGINNPKSVFDLLERKRKSERPWKQTVANILDGVPFTMLSIVFTMLILYADLIRAAAAPPSTDPYFLGFTIFAITAFCVEIALSCLVRRGYFLKFYFWMDLIASISLLCDIPAFVNLVTIQGDDSNRHVFLDRMSKAAQAGARSARIMQVIAVLQLLHMRAKRVRKGSRRLTDDSCNSDNDESAPKFQMTTVNSQSRVGEKMNEMTMRKVILGVLLILLVIPVFDTYVFYGHQTVFEDGGLVTLHDIFLQEGNSSGFQAAVKDYVVENQFVIGGRKTGFLLHLTVCNQSIYNRGDEPVLRRVEKQSSIVKSPSCTATMSNATGCQISEAWIDVKWIVQFQAILDICRTTFLLTILSLGAVLFIRDTDALVLRPIERMIQTVKQMSHNPLSARTIKSTASKKNMKMLETKILENSISKVCNLLSVGFGEAGAEIISNNIRSDGDINPMLPGKKVRAIFGFCDIRSFTDATEVFQEDVMEFVNSIASIVHAEVSFHGGSANKNVGDAFLVVWKLPTGDPVLSKSRRGSIIEAKSALSSGDPQSDSSAIAGHLAEAALASMIIIHASLQRSPIIQKFEDREDINERIPGYKVRMGFGLHVGWAIEGAVGSKYKIDPTYLSPHVNMAARLEAATKQYGVPILLSDSFVSMLPSQTRLLCRAIDTVLVKGSKVPTELYTYDMEPEARACEYSDSKRLSFTCNDSSDHVSYSDYPYLDEFKEHPDILACVSCWGREFQGRFDDAYAAYIEGKWSKSISILQEIRHQSNIVDGPTEVLLQFMGSHGGHAPADWNGCRMLMDK